jgi:NitT/TauT family transport system substrate-binding protein
VFVQAYLAHAPLLVAEAEGYFAEQGIEVEWVRLSDPAAATPMLLNGTLDVMPGGASPGVLNAMSRGLPIRAVSDKGYFEPNRCSRGGLLLRSDLAKPGGGLGKRVRRISIDRQPQQQYLVERMLSTVGLRLQDLEVLYIPHLPEIDAFSKKTVDLALAGDPYTTMLIDRKLAVQLVRQEDVFPGMQFSFLFFGPSLLQKNPNAGVRFLAAYLKAARQLDEGKTAHNLDVVTRVTDEGAEAVKQMCWPAYYRDGHVDFQSIADFQTWALQRKFIDRVVTADEFYEPELVARANAALAQEKTDK